MFAERIDNFEPNPTGAGPHAATDAPQASGEREEVAPAVLIVEDERVARRALKTLLTASGFPAAAAESAEEALRLLRQMQSTHPRIALVDFNLPGMNGLDFISELEQMDPGVMPVLMTASSEDIVGEAVRDRNLVYLRKPLDVAQLLNVISHGDERH